jgi:hypothetical protein
LLGILLPTLTPTNVNVFRKSLLPYVVTDFLKIIIHVITTTFWTTEN